MGARINRLNRRADDPGTTPRINWHLRYRACKKFGHKGMPCGRCKVTLDDGLGALGAFIADSVVPYVVQYIERQNVFYQYFKRGR